ncbi:hypothetical protein BGM09_10260 [Streptomyces sp. CBMA29]|nr:hypothetical protein [Streptomyces sp. CBMA29]
MPQVGWQGSKVVRVRNPDAPRISGNLRVAEMPRDDFEDDAIIKGALFDGEHLIGRQVEALEAEGCAFENLRFTGMGMIRSQISDSRIVTCDFAEVSAQDVSLIRCTVTGSRMTGSSWKASTFRDVTFENCTIAPAMFRNTKLFAVAFIDCRMSGADFQFAEMHNTRFVNCDLTGAQFANVKMGTVRFENSTLIDVGGAAHFKGATVQGPGSMELALSLAREVGINFE